MRLATAGIVALVLALPPPAAADDLGGRQALQCADRVLEWLMGQPTRPHNPTVHVGLGAWFMGCSYYLPPVVGPILNGMRADLESIVRHREELPRATDADGLYRYLVCGAWAAIYSNTYYSLIPGYGSDIVGGLPEPDTHTAACNRWVEGT